VSFFFEERCGVSLYKCAKVQEDRGCVVYMYGSLRCWVCRWHVWVSDATSSHVSFPHT